MVIPTLTAGPNLVDCLTSVVTQRQRDFEVVIVDNSGKQLVREGEAARFGAAIIENSRNVGYGAAINQAVRQSRAPFIAVLNDDAVARPGWLGALVAAMEAREDVGMCASQVRLAGKGVLDSAGMVIAPDGTSKQRGQGEPPEAYGEAGETLFPSGSAALYRRTMLDEIGLFDESFFLYCEDTDLGLRGRWAGWKCWYVPEAVVEHLYSQTAGAASPLKAYLVERNRLLVVLKNFPLRLLLRAPFATMVRYFWYVIRGLEGRGSAGQFRRESRGLPQMAFLAARAHASALVRLRRSWRERRRIMGGARITAEEFGRLAALHGITSKQVAAL